MKKSKVKLGRPRGRKYEKISVSLPKDIVKVLNDMEKTGQIKNKSKFISSILEAYIFAKDPKLSASIHKMRKSLLPLYYLVSRLISVAREKGENTDFDDILKTFNQFIKDMEIIEKET